MELPRDRSDVQAQADRILARVSDAQLFAPPVDVRSLVRQMLDHADTLTKLAEDLATICLTQEK